ncbi:tRNA lysidine(34) synthetase TilS [Enterovibrio paralichthyis]|uniref:tRNA lysidine(34) synthetase TilS n=1 Tax=Enterovibrio paralichthyis TaxID=2853805 RepID=UPI001C47CF07|nr:tRNA lysidine(34) synthetase TilS [Enterovibrio paralichthyis]MBV7300963.1 tRNA lysidine(34) synthetase TilS [Enterovibrio paralichthyis]
MLFSQFETALDPLATSPRQIVLAFSGGVDSRVLLDLLSTYRDIHPQHRYLVIHIHHGLSTNANHWLKRCEEWATETDFAFRGIKVTLDGQGESLEKQARDARYQAILGAAEQDALVLTGQHADDQAETFLLALKRGSGPAGLAAMPVVRKFGHAWLCRPLLNVTRYQIESYAEQQGLTWLEDESNLDCRFDRNFIRQQWMPMASKRWPGIVKAINRTAALCAEQEALMEELLVAHDEKVVQPDSSISIAALGDYSANMQNALVRRWLKRAGVTLTQAQLQQLFSSVIDAAQDANPSIKLKMGEIRRYQGRVYIISAYKDVTEWRGALSLNTHLVLPDGMGEISLSNAETGRGLNLRSPAENEQVCVTFDPEGRFAHPVGRQGKRKLKKLFQEYGVPSWLRRRTPLIFYGEEIAAVADLFVCDGFGGQDCELVWHKHHSPSA